MQPATLLILAAAFLLVLLWRERAGRAARREHERALAAVRDGEARFRDFAEAASDWLWETDAEGRYSYISERGLAATGLAREQIVGRSREDVLRGMLDAQALAEHLELYRARKPFRDFVCWIRHPAGLRCLVANGTPVFDDRGRFRGYRGVARDATEERLARDEAARLAAAVESSGDAIVGADLDRVITSWNRGAERLYGWTAAEAIGRHIDLIAPRGAEAESRAEMERIGAAIAAGERVETFDTSRSRKDGSVLRISLSVTPMRDATGAVVGSVGIGRDISARLAAEAELRRERERSLDFAEATSDWFWETDPELRMTFISSRFEELTGVPLAERLGRHWASVPRDDPAAWDAVLGEIERRQPFRDFQYRRRDAAGRERWFSVSGKPHFGADGEFLGYRGTGREVTREIAAREAAAQAELRLRTALQNIAEGFALFDAEDRLVFCNEQYRILSGKAASVLAPGLKFEDYLRAGLEGGEMPEAIGAEEAWLERRMAHHRNPTGPLELMRSGRWLRLVESRLPDGGSILVAADVTEARQREHRMREAQKLEAVGRLTGGVAHDFNNLLAVIVGNTEILEERLAGDPESRKLARNSVRAALRGAELTQRLLAFARRQPLKPEPTDVNQLAGSVAELLKRTLGAHIEIETKLKPGLSGTLVDPGQLENALLNLAFNARDAMPGGGRLTIATGAAERAPEVDGDGGFVTIAVSDTGVGMPAEVAARAFEPFFTTKEPGKGSGLGLSMVYGFARQSGGGLALESEPGRGATVTLYLPRSDEAAPARREEASAQATEGGERVLLVEDTDDVRELARRMLEGLGYRVVEARDGATALAELDRSEPFDLLLTDMMLTGGINGAELARRACERRPQLKVLCMSGYSEQAAAVVGSDAPLPLIGKPFRRAELARAVRDALAGQAPSRPAA